MSDVTRILSAIEQGDPKAAEELLPLVYDELRRLAARRLAREGPARRSRRRPWSTKLTSDWSAERATPWNGRTHFFPAAAEAMRWILVDRARGKRSEKRGGKRRRVDLDLAAEVVDGGLGRRGGARRGPGRVRPA